MLEGVLNFLDEGGGILKIKVLRLGQLYKMSNIWYLSPTAPFSLLMTGTLIDIISVTRVDKTT
jgi:hypothetical protein